MILKVEFSAGKDILRASEEAVRLARHLDCTVEFDFNGVTCLADASGDPETLANNYYAEATSKRRFKFARSTK